MDTDILLKMARLNILYIEDEDRPREVVSKHLKRWFNDVLVASSGEEALEMFLKNQNRVDIVLADIYLDGISGIEVVSEIKKINPLCKAIFISAYSESKMLISAIKAGADGYIVKPIKLENIKAELSSCTQKIIDEQIEKRTLLPSKERLSNTLRDKSGAILVVEIANFSEFNITYSLESSNSALLNVIEFLNLFKQPQSTLFHIYESTFAIFLENGSSEDFVHLVGILDVVQKGHSFGQSSSQFMPLFLYGISSGVDGDMILQRALYALKETKKQNCKNYSVVLDFKDKALENRVDFELMAKIEEVLENNELLAFYQPIMDNKSNKITKFEALARIRDKDKIITPNLFLSQAKKVGMLPFITRQIINRAFLEFSKNSFELSINLSEEDFRDEGVVGFILNRAKHYNIEASRVSFEITEGISLNMEDSMISQILEIKNAGFKLSIDDFGVENSNFCRLLNIKADFIKIDGAFIRNITNNSESYQITKAIHNFSKSFGAKSVAEYVHSDEVLKAIKEIGIDYSQGYHIGKPEELLKMEFV